MELKLINKDLIKDDSNGSQKIIITKNSVNDDYRLFDMYYSDGEYAASVAWMGKSLSTGEKIMQPAITTNSPETRYLSYDGQANYIGGSDQIIMPSNGSLYYMETDQLHYFNNDNPLVHNVAYDLDFNNKSIRMNNISIFNKDFSKGIMLDFRASMEGTFSDETKNGYIVVLAAIDPIN